jgi:hypothetical protein
MRCARDSEIRVVKDEIRGKIRYVVDFDQSAMIYEDDWNSAPTYMLWFSLLSPEEKNEVRKSPSGL